LSKVISPQPQDYERWELPDVGRGAAHGGNARPSLMTAKEIERIHAQAHEEGFSLGRREGLEKGRAMAEEQLARLKNICDQLHAPLQALDHQVVEELTGLAVVIAQHIIRREIKADPGQIVATIEQAVSELPVASRGVRLHLNPDDSVLVKELLAEKIDSAGWEIVDDPLLSRGGCKVATETSRIDASIERRLMQVVTELLGGEREEDHAHG